MEIYRRLAEGNPAAFENDVALTCNNLGFLFYDMHRFDEAEQYLREALGLYRKLVKGNPAAYEADMALPIYNLGLLERDRGHTATAKRYFRESLALYEKYPHLAKDAQKARDALNGL